MELGRRRAHGPDATLPGSDRRARTLAVARERPGSGACAVAGERSTTSRAPQSSGDPDDLSLLDLVQGESPWPGLFASLAPRRNARLASQARWLRRYADNASHHARGRLGAELPPRLRRRPRRGLPRGGADGADGA